MFEITGSTTWEPERVSLQFSKCYNLESPQKRYSAEELSRSSYSMIISLEDCPPLISGNNN